MVKLIALDLDGTLLTPQGHITPESKAAIQEARSAGVKVVLATGRGVPEGVFFAQEAGCDELAVCLGGGVLADTRTGAHVRRWDIAPETARKALALCQGRDIELMVFAGEEIVLDPFSQRTLLQAYPYPVFHEAAVVVSDPAAYLEEHRLPLTKLHGDRNPAAYPLRELAALPGLSLTSSSDHDFELVAAGVNKGSTLALLALMYGIPLENCAAVGDSPNDLEMLQVVGYPIAMGNASQAVKETARYITGDNAHGGVVQAIRHCLVSG